MDYPTRKPKKRAPEVEHRDDGLEVGLAEFTAPLGEEFPWRSTTVVLELDERWRDLRPERGRLH